MNKQLLKRHLKNYFGALLRLMLLSALFCATQAQAQLGPRVVAGYFHNWDAADAPYINLAEVDPQYNVINVSFAVPTTTGDMTMVFEPAVQTAAAFKADIQTLQAQGRKVQISIGGANAPVELLDDDDVSDFVTSMKSIISTYGFDGLDIDLEGTSVILNSGDTDFKNPTTPKVVNLITAAREVVTYFRDQGIDFTLTAAPETQYVQGGYGTYGIAFGGYLPVLYGLRDILTFVHVQYYNTGTQFGLDDNIYAQSTADFIVAMTDMLLTGFPVGRDASNVFPALRQDQVAFGLPATNTGAAPSGGYLAPAEVKKALDYLIKGTSFGGDYVASGVYPDLRGIMTWSVNWDATQGNEFASNYYDYFSSLEGGNVAPAVSLTSPASNAAFNAGDDITLTATATDSDGSVASVAFYNGTTLLGQVTTSPYTFTWASVAAGSYTLTARATDDDGAVATSSSVTVSVISEDNAVPTVSLTAPADGASYTAPAAITLTATAADTDGSIAAVAFYNGTTLLSEVTTSPYTYTWSSVAAGTYSLSAQATDNEGAAATTAAISITVTQTSTGDCEDPEWTATGIYVNGDRVSYQGNIYQAKWWTQGEDPETHSAEWDVWTLMGACTGSSTNASPTIALTAPADGTAYTSPASVSMTATAADTDGSVALVEFYNGTTKLGEATASPYTYTWASVTAGAYTLTAVATDDDGATTTSAAVTISVTAADNANPTVAITAPATGASFTAPATIALTATAADTDGTIASVMFYHGSNLLATVVTSPYTYSWESVTAGTYALTAVATDDDGAVVTSSAITVTVASEDTGSDCDAPTYVDGSSYATGDVVVNNDGIYTCTEGGWCSQGGAYEPGVGWAWAYAWTYDGECTDGDGGSGTGSSPTVTLTAPTAGSTYDVGATVTLTATASDSDGTITQVTFYVDGTAVSTATATPYTATWTATQGYHSLTAAATDDSGNTTTSAAVTISAGSNEPGALPNRILSGYWHSWDGGTPFIPLNEVSPKWDVINVSFAEPVVAGSTDGEVQFVMSGGSVQYTVADFKNDIVQLQSQGKRIVISIGGYEGYFSLTSAAARDNFVSNMIEIIDEYGFDGIDIDLEQTSLELEIGDADFANPTSPKVVYMIEAIQAIVDHYDDDFMLTFAPEAFYLQLGFQWYGGIHDGVDRRAGVYIPLIDAFRDRLTYVQAQLYNQPSIMATDGTLYTSGSSDFLVSMSEMLLTGFYVGGSSYFFEPLRPDQVLFGVPASASAAGSGQVTSAQLEQAFDYMVSGTAYGGSYQTSGTYPGLRGIMTWSINWDVFQNDNSFVDTYRSYLDGLTVTASSEVARAAADATVYETDSDVTETTATRSGSLTVAPNPAPAGTPQTLRLTSAEVAGPVQLLIIRADGSRVLEQTYTRQEETIQIPLPALRSGFYLLQVRDAAHVWTARYLVE